MPTISLTEEQLQIVCAEPAHYLITAVAGSGKTTTLAHRIQHLLEQGYDAKRILILMFNRAAREDFNHKLSQVVTQNSKPEVRTFHSMGYRLYQRFIREGHLPPFHTNILSEKEVDFHIWRLLNQLLQAEELRDAKRNKKEHVEICHQFIEEVKSGLHSPQAVFLKLQLNSKFNYVVQLFELFEQWRKQQARISYTDMLYDPVMAIINKPELDRLVSNKMDILLVDEYQDTNDIQHELLKRIAGTRAKITVVGDPDQTIYEFRGAKPEYIIKGFSKEFPESKNLNLSYSFRYGHSISLLANHLISNNKNRLDLLCKSHSNNPETDVYKHHCYDETVDLVNLIKPIDKTELSTCAILTRVWSQTVSIELALLEQRIPYRMDGHRGVFSSSEMQSLQCVLEIAAGSFVLFAEEKRRDKLYLLFHFPHVGLPDNQIKAICAHLARFDQHWGKILLDEIPSDLNRIQTIKLERLARSLIKVEQMKRPVKAILVDYIQDTDLYEGIRSLSLSHDHAEEKIASLKGVARFISQRHSDAGTVLLYLEELQKNAQQLSIKPTTRQPIPAVHLTTIHRAKGLEWNTVFIPGLNDRTLPYSFRSDALSVSQLESERRLLYVAITRTIQTLHLFVPKKQANSKVQRSRFEYELNFQASQELAECLALKTGQCKLSDKGKLSKIIQQYASEMACTLTQNDISTNVHKPDKEDDNNPPIWFSRRVMHCVLGEGNIKEEQAGSFSVEFHDQQIRVFSKETAERFFTAIS